MRWRGFIAIVALLAALAGETRAQRQSWSLERRAAPSSLGWSEEGLAAVRRFAESNGTAAMIVVTDDLTVLAWGPTSHRFRAHSMRKSFLSALIGIAIERGQIETAATLADLDIDDAPPLTARERTATVLQLLQARSGVYHAAASETAEMRSARPQRGAFSPGEHWYYNNWDFNTLGTIYTRAAGETVGAAFAKEIAAPTGMQDFRAEDVRDQLEDVSRHAAYKFRISARDLARFGLLFLHDGAWGDRQVVPRAWVVESTALRSRTDQSGSKSGYGLMWWVTATADDGLPPGSYTASGSGGQRLTILPGIDTVVVHLMDTDLDGGPRIGTSTYNELLRRLLAARQRPVPGNVIARRTPGDG
jgi:CubicO group peptidase (beta-lactamase class C family)